MAMNQVMINFDGHTQFKVLQGASFTVPDSANSPSPVNASSGVSPVTVFDAKKASVGGFLFTSFSDIAGNAVTSFPVKLSPGDVVACSAVASSLITVTVNGVVVGTVAATAVGGVIGVWG
jgi:hypothetical protein